MGKVVKAMRQRGFTLIELMVTLAILAILAGLGVPSFRTFIGEQRLKAASFELQSALLLARSEAVKRGMAGSVTVTASDTTGSPRNWGQGWVIAAGGQTIARQGEFREVSVVEANDVGVVTYSGEGRVPAADAADVAFSLSIPANSAVRSRCVRIGLTGMPYSKLNAGGACS